MRMPKAWEIVAEANPSKTLADESLPKWWTSMSDEDRAAYVAEYPNSTYASIYKEQESSKIESRVDMSAEVAGRGLCPECKVPMQKIMAGSSMMWVCNSDRITIPLPDNE